MSVKIRLARAGRKKVPFYHVVAVDSRKRRDSGFIEQLGFYNPLLEKGEEKRLSLNVDRIKYWLSVGAKPSDRVALLLIESKVEGAEKYKPVFTPKQKKEETNETQEENKE